MKTINYNEKTLTPCEIQDYLVDNYGFKVSKSVNWEYVVKKDGNEFNHDKNGTFLGHVNHCNLRDNVYNKVNTVSKLETYLRIIGVSKIPKETLLDAFQVVTILIRDYGFTKDKAISEWNYVVVNENLQLNFHYNHGSSIYYQFQGSEVYGNQLEFMNTEEKLHNFMKQFTKGTSMDELNSLQIMEIAVRDYGFMLELKTRNSQGCPWSHVATLKYSRTIELYDDAPSEWLIFKIDGDLVDGLEGEQARENINTKNKIHKVFARLGIKRVEKEQILLPTEILNLAAMDYGFKLGRGSTKNDIDWEYMATLEGDSTIKLFGVNDTGNGAYIGTEFNGVQSGGSGWEKYKELNTARKFHAWCRLNNINPIPKTLTPDEILSSFEIITLAQAEYGFKPVKELSANNISWNTMVALEGFKRVVLFDDLDSNWIGVEVNGEYKINPCGFKRWEALNTKAKFATWFKSLNIKKETTLDTNLSVREIFTELENNHGFKVAKNSQLFEGSCKWGYVAFRGAVAIYCDRLEDEWINGRVNGVNIGGADFVRSLLKTKHKINRFINRHFAIRGLTQGKLPVAKNDFKVGDKIIDGSNDSYLIVSEFMTTGIKMFTLQGVNTGSFYTQHAPTINCVYTKEKQPILWTTMADGAKIKGTGERGCYTITRKWETLKNVEAKEAGHYYRLSFNGDVLVSGADCVDDYLEYANKHNLE